IPVSKSQIFSTAADNQSQVEIHVVQGERPMAKDNKSLGQFILDGITPAPRGVPQIEVTFDIDADGILIVSAKDKSTVREQSITITDSSGLSESDIEEMMKEAERHAEADRKLRELQEARNQADSTVYSAEKLLRDYGDRLPEDAKKRTQEKIDEVRKTMDSNDAARIRSATDDLMREVQQLGAQMYQSGSTTGGESGGDRGGEDVVEGEVVEE